MRERAKEDKWLNASILVNSVNLFPVDIFPATVKAGRIATDLEPSARHIHHVCAIVFNGTLLHCHQKTDVT